MSSEIVSALDGMSETASSAADVLDMSSKTVPPLDGTSGSGLSTADATRCRRPLKAIRAFDLLGLRADGHSRVKVDLIGGNHHIRHFVAPEKGHKYVTRLNPTPAFVKLTLDEMKEPSWLLLRGCDQLLQQSDFPFEKFKTLTALEISGVTNPITLPAKAISEMIQLQSLNLSHLLIETLPEGFFSDLRELRLVNLRGCSKLCYLPSTEPLRYLEVLDLSHCTSLQEPVFERNFHPNLKMLDLSCTALPRRPSEVTSSELTHLFLRDAKVIELDDFSLDIYNVEVLDLSGAENVKDIRRLEFGCCLVALDISRTEVESVEFICGMFQLRYLILRECTRLVKLPAMGRLENIEVLDLSGSEILADLPGDLSNLRGLKDLNLSGCSCLKKLREGLFDQMPFLEKLDLSKTNINNLPSFANLNNLQTLNISHTPVEEVPGLSNLINLRELVLFCRLS